MNIQQKATLIACLIFIIMALAPSFMPRAWSVTQALRSFGTIGALSVCIIALMILRFEGAPMLNWRAIAKSSVSWDIIFIVAAAVYVCNSVAQPQTGLKEFIVQSMTPILGNKPSFVFVGILLIFALITANFANNAGMASILIPVALAFQDMYPDVPMIAVCMSICMVVFITGATPAGSPYAAMLHGQHDKITFKQIENCMIPMIILAWVLYTFIGYPFASFIFGLF